MPLTPLPASNTPRVLIGYTSGGLRHHADYRVASGTTKAAVLASITGLISAIAAVLPTGDAVDEALFIPAGTNISQTMAITPVNGSVTVATIDDVDRSRFFSMTGRSDDGRRVRFTVFTPIIADAWGYRQARSEADAGLNAVANALIALSPGALTISGDGPSWKAYFNYGQNAAFQRSQR